MKIPSAPARASRARRPGPESVAAAALCLAALSVPALGAGLLPESFDATYVLSAKGVEIGETRWTLERGDGDHRVYESRTKAIGIARILRDERIHERSEWHDSEDGGVRPLRYRYQRSGGKRERIVEVVFDWQGKRVHNTLNGNSWSMPIEPGMLDKLVYLLELMHDLSAGLTEARYQVADGGKVKTYLLTRVGEERIETVVGPMDAVVVERRRVGDKRLTRIWCARELAYLPVRVEHLEDGERVRLTLVRLDRFAPAP
jgi:hypothetical protein